MGRPNIENLVPCTPENASARGKKGGAVNSPAQRWNSRKYCNRHCNFYNRCPAISSSKSLMPVSKNNKDNYPCFIKAQPKEVQNYFLNLFDCGEEGLIKVIMDLHFRLMLKTQSMKITSRELKEALEVSLNMKKSLYGDKDSKDQTIINIIVSNQVDV